MEGTEMEARKSETAIRCAKAAILLSSLKSSPILRVRHDQEKVMLMTEIRDLKTELMRERVKRKRIKFCGLMELILQVLLLLSLSTFLLLLAFMSS